MKNGLSSKVWELVVDHNTQESVRGRLIRKGKTKQVILWSHRNGETTYSHAPVEITNIPKYLKEDMVSIIKDIKGT